MYFGLLHANKLAWGMRRLGLCLLKPTFYNISDVLRLSGLLTEETGVSGEYHRPTVSP
jgi:hypothetical protein